MPNEGGAKTEPTGAARGGEHEIAIERPPRLGALAHLAGLTTFAVAQPLFDNIQRNPEFLIVRHSEGVDVWVLITSLVILLPLALWTVPFSVGRWNRPASQVVLSIIVGLISTLCVLPLLRWLFRDDLPALATMLIAGGIGCAVGLNYASGPAARLLLTLISPAAIIYPSIFIFKMSFLLFPAPVRAAIGGVGQVGRPADVVLIIFDELPTISLLDSSGKIDFRRFPNFARLASMGTWYPKANTDWPRTKKAVRSILTGVVPPHNIRPELSEYERNLFTMFGPDYSYNVIEQVTRLFPKSYEREGAAKPQLAFRLSTLASDVSVLYLHHLLPKEYRSYLPDVGGQWIDFWSPPTNRKLSIAAGYESMAANVAKETGPTLSFIHTLLPHAPWRHLPDGRTYNIFPFGPIFHEIGVELQFPQELVEHLRQRHLLQTGYCDRVLGELLDNLEAKGRLEQAMIVVTADHGIKLQSGALPRKLTLSSVPEILFVPLLIKYPGQTEGVISGSKARSVDILPTIADVVEAEMSWDFEGTSLLDPNRPDTDARLISRGEYPGGSRDTAYSVDEMYATLLKRLETQSAVLRLNEPDADFFRFGMYGKYVGRELADLPGKPPPLDVKFVSPGLWSSVRLSSDFIPVLVAGRIVSAPAAMNAESRVALIINGTVGAISAVAKIQGEYHFSGIVIPSTFREGKNEVRVYLLSNSDDP